MQLKDSTVLSGEEPPLQPDPHSANAADLLGNPRARLAFQVSGEAQVLGYCA
jgi:hypothetical protein